MASGVARRASASRARRGGPDVVGRVAIQSLLDGARCHRQRLATCIRFNGLEVQPIDSARSYERLDLGDDLRLEGFFEPPFLAASCKAASPLSSLASHNRSLNSTNS